MRDMSHMRVSGVARRFRIAGHDGVVHCPMLLEQQFTRAGPYIELRAIEEYALAQQRKQTTHYVQKHSIVRRFSNSDVEINVTLGG